MFVSHSIGGAREGSFRTGTKAPTLPFALRSHGIILPRAKKMSPVVRMKSKPYDIGGNARAMPLHRGGKIAPTLDIELRSVTVRGFYQLFTPFYQVLAQFQDRAAALYQVAVAFYELLVPFYQLSIAFHRLFAPLERERV